MKDSLKRVFLLLLILVCLPFAAEAASRPPLTAEHAVVASVHEIASRVGVETMRKGGTAVDAAVAVAFTLAVVWPEAGNIGGGGFMLIRKPDGTTEAIDYRERAPLAATRNLYIDANGNVIPDLSTVGHKAVAVPGTIAGLALALKRHGKLQWRDLIAPAIELAEKGYMLSPIIVRRTLNHKDTLSKFSESKRIFLRNGKFYAPGERFIQPELARTLKRLQQNGPREFYEGETARLLVRNMKENRGLITMKDLQEYEPTIRKPIRGTYRGYEILTMPPPSSGGIALIAMLNMLERFDIQSFGFHSSDHLHALIEAMKRAFADRSTFLGDPDFVKVPVETLVSKKHVAGGLPIDMRTSTPAKRIQPNQLHINEGSDTTHFTIIDSAGTIVANTYTLNDSFGSGVTVPNAGFLLNNEMDDFTAKPGVPNLYGLLQSEKNAIQPRKRPLSSMTPVIVLKEGKPYFAIGSPGGPVIINSVLQVIVNLLDFGMDLQQAVEAHRFHHQWMPDEIYVEPYGINSDTRKALESRGHKFATKYFFTDTEFLGDVHAAGIDLQSGKRVAASDPRRGGMAAGW